jgi:hypothetical protein
VPKTYWKVCALTRRGEIKIVAIARIATKVARLVFKTITFAGVRLSLSLFIFYAIPSTT